MDTRTECGGDARSSLIRGHPILTTADDGRTEVLMAAPVARRDGEVGGTGRSPSTSYERKELKAAD